jgi:hypothetical protein
MADAAKTAQVSYGRRKGRRRTKNAHPADRLSKFAIDKARPIVMSALACTQPKRDGNAPPKGTAPRSGNFSPRRARRVPADDGGRSIGTNRKTARTQPQGAGTVEDDPLLKLRISCAVHSTMPIDRLTTTEQNADRVLDRERNRSVRHLLSASFG